MCSWSIIPQRESILSLALVFSLVSFFRRLNAKGRKERITGKAKEENDSLPAQELKEKQLSERYVKFILSMVDRAHQRYCERAHPPENFRKYLETYVDIVKKEIWRKLRKENER